MLWLWYEDMKTHHEQVVRKVAEFLGIEDDQAIKVSAAAGPFRISLL